MTVEADERPSDQPVPLTAEDRAILDLENDFIAGHTCKVVRLEGRLSAPDLREAVRQRLGDAPLLSYRLGGSGDAPAWVPDHGIDLDWHISDEGGPPSGGTEEAVAALFAQRLDRDRPLWRIDVLAAERETVLVWRIHHALADGMTAMRMAEAVLFDPAPAAQKPQARAHAKPGAADASRGHAGFLRREFGRSVRRGPFDRAPGHERVVAFASTGLEPLHDAARRLAGATLNDAVLLSVAGGVRRWLDQHGSSGGKLRIKVPVSLHSVGDEQGNRDSFFIVGVPLAEGDPAESLAAVNQETMLRKQHHDAQEMDSLLRHLGGHSKGLEKVVDRIEQTGRAFALNVSNVPGPQRELSVLGVPVTSLHSLAEIAPHHSLRVAVVSADGNLNFGIVADPEVVDDPAVIAAGVEEDAARIVAT